MKDSPLLDVCRTSPNYAFRWKVSEDYAKIHRISDGASVFCGSLLPCLHIADETGESRYVKAKVSEQNEDTLTLIFDDVATGNLSFKSEDDGFHFERFTLRWTSKPRPIIALHFGLSELTAKERLSSPLPDVAFWPDWIADGVCIPSCRTGPMQTFIRRWDLGQCSDIALGNFAPAQGTPYGAAFPRPLLAAGLGGDAGWVVIGTRSLPDGSMSLRTRSGCCGIELRYREDIWGALPGLERVWEQPLNMNWAIEAIDAWMAFYEVPSEIESHDSTHQISSWNTWGNFRQDIFNLPELIERSQNDMEVEVLLIDDPWEEMNSNSKPDFEKLPNFDKDVRKALDNGLRIGVWQSVGWIDDPQSVGLGNDDLLCGRDGHPRLGNWSFNPRETGTKHYCLDPSSEHTRNFLRTRTRDILSRHPISMVKLDFGYGLPGPDAAVPRDPRYRGEKLGFALEEIIAETVREFDPNISLIAYSLHPLHVPTGDVVSLDDLGDSADREAEGHGQWAVWASIAGARGQAINASSGYNWESDGEILLNTAILGAPGAVLPLDSPSGNPVPHNGLLRRKALARWHRRTTGWKPLWLNTHRGSLSRDPEPRCWGRMESHSGVLMLTALVLREAFKEGVNVPSMSRLEWSGDWVLIAQDNSPLHHSKSLAVVPFSSGHIAFDFVHEPRRVTAHFEKSSEDFPAAQWNKGLLELEINDAIYTRGLIGITIESV